MTARRRTIVAVGAALVIGFSSVSKAAEPRSLTVTSAGSSLELPATLFVPEGAGRFPAVVIMHDCSGLGPRSSGAPRRWAEHLVAQGYVVIIADSFSPRGLPNGVCTIPPAESARAAAGVRWSDAFGALAVLRSLPFVDRERIGIMGGSHGGASTLATMAQNTPEGFAAGLALYPNCAQRFGSWRALRQDGNTGPVTGYAGLYRTPSPLLILIGEADDWSPAEHCRRMAALSSNAGYAVDIVVYPGAHHSFDSAAPVRFVAERTNSHAPGGKGATTGGDPAAWADAKLRVTEFFGRHLKR